MNTLQPPCLVDFSPWQIIRRLAHHAAILLTLSCTATACAQTQPAASQPATSQSTSQPTTQPVTPPRAGGPQQPVDPNIATVYPGITNISSVITQNPNKGWAIYSWGRMPTGFLPEAMDCATIVYIRPDWADLEPDREGGFNWNLIDDHLVAARALHKKVAFRVMGTNPSSGRVNTFPKWVMDGYEDQFESTTFEIDGRNKTQIYPKDPGKSPRWKYAVQHLVKELGTRYDGNPDVAFIEVGTIGDWGEQISNYAKTNQMLSQEDWREHMGWYRDAFKKTAMISVTAGQHNMQYQFADENRIGRRSDGFCAPMVIQDTTNGGYQDGRQIDKSFDYKLPSFLEFPPGSAPIAAGRNFTWGKFWKGIVVYGRPTYLGYNFGTGEANGLATEYPYRLIESHNRVGYHIVAERVSYPLDLFTKGTGKVSFAFRNDGVKYPDYPIYTALAVLDANNNVLQTLWCDDVDLRTHAEPWISYEWVSDQTGRFHLPVPKIYNATANVSMAPNTHAVRLAMGFFSDKTLGQPDIRLGNEGRMPSGWYPLDKYSVTPQADAYPSLHNLSFQKTAITSAPGKGDVTALTDGNASTLWSSPAEPNQWVTIDMGSSRKFSVIMLDWDANSATSYTLEGSQNGASWTPLCDVGNGDGGKDYLNVPNAQTRYIRLSTQSPAGISLYDFEVLGSEEARRPARGRRF